MPADELTVLIQSALLTISNPRGSGAWWPRAGVMTKGAAW